jgi:multiple sugar transport system substrate-binding protein
MMKKIVIIGLLGLLAGLLALSAGAEPTVNVASRLWSRPVEQEFVIQEIFPPFEQEHGCKVVFQYLDNDALFERAAIQQATGQSAMDVVIVYGPDMQQWVQAGYVRPLDAPIASWADRTFSQGLAKMTRFDDRQFFVPIGADVYLLIANRRALPYLPEGADVQQLTWAQLVEWANAVAAGEGVGKFAVTGAPQKMLIYQYGAAILSYGGAFPTIYSAEALNAWELLVQMQTAHPPNVLQYVNVVEPMKREDAWVSVTHCARVGDIYRSAPAQFVVAPVPRGPAGIGSVAGTSGLGIMQDAPQPELAVKLVEYLSRPDVQLKIAKGTGGFIPPVDEAVGLLGQTPEDDVIRKALHVMDQGVLAFIPATFGPNWGSVKAVYDRAFRKLVLEDGAVDAAYLEQAQQEINHLTIR